MGDMGRDNATRRAEREEPKPLTPPDYEQCQAEVPNGHSFMTLGGRPGLERCKNKSAWIATEKVPDEYEKKGSMSLCPRCAKVFKKQCPGAGELRGIGMDLRKHILDRLLANGCTYGIRNGIVTVEVPVGTHGDKEIWDFTVPQRRSP